MTSPAKGTARSAPAVRWFDVPIDEEAGETWTRHHPRLGEGASLLARVNGETVEVTCERHHGIDLLFDEDHNQVDWSNVEAVAERPRNTSRSGPSRTYAEQRAAGITTVTIRLDKPTLRKLDALCDDGGMSRADMIRAMIDAEWAEWRGLTSGRKASTGGAGEGVG